MKDYGNIGTLVGPVARRHGVERVSLFGSRARGDARPDSDYDLLIQKGDVTTLWKFAAFWEDMENALGGSVDILTEGSPDQQLLENARKDAIVLYERQR